MAEGVQRAKGTNTISSHGRKDGRTRWLSEVSFVRALVPFIRMESSWPNHFQYVSFGGTHTFSHWNTYFSAEGFGSLAAHWHYLVWVAGGVFKKLRSILPPQNKTKQNQTPVIGFGHDLGIGMFDSFQVESSLGTTVIGCCEDWMGWYKVLRRTFLAYRKCWGQVCWWRLWWFCDWKQWRCHFLWE